MNNVVCERPTMAVREDAHADASYLEQEGFDERRQDYRDGRFGFVGIRARAVLLLADEDGGSVEQVVESPGCWGVEDDAGEEHFECIFHEELRELTGMLRALGVTMPQPA